MLCMECIIDPLLEPARIEPDRLGMWRAEHGPVSAILDELMIKHNAGVYTSPEWRLARGWCDRHDRRTPRTRTRRWRAVKSMNQAVNKPPGADAL